MPEKQERQKLTMECRFIIDHSPTTIDNAFAVVFANPLPAIVRLDLKSAHAEIMRMAKEVSAVKLEALKKAGAIEDNGMLYLKESAPTYPEYRKEMDEVAARTFELPLTAKIKMPCQTSVGGTVVDIATVEPAQTIMDQFVEWVR